MADSGGGGGGGGGLRWMGWATCRWVAFLFSWFGFVPRNYL